MKSALRNFTKYLLPVVVSLLALASIFPANSREIKFARHKLRRGANKIDCFCAAPNECVAGSGVPWCGNSETECDPNGCDAE